MRARLRRARSASPRRAQATKVRYPERTSFSSSGSASRSERAAVSADWARSSRGWSCRCWTAGAPRLAERGVELLRLDIEAVGVLVVKVRGDVLPVVAQRGGELLLRGNRDQGAVRHQLEQLAEAVDRQHVRHVGTLRRLGRGGDLGELAVLGGELRRRGDLDPLRLLERALREGREEREPLDLDVEQLERTARSSVAG